MLTRNFTGTDITLGDPGFVDSTWRFLAGEPDCADVENGNPEYQSDDVSSSEGVRCTNCSDLDAPSDIREFEVHTAFEHFSRFPKQPFPFLTTVLANLGSQPST